MLLVFVYCLCRFEESMHSYNLLGLSSTLGTGYELASQV